VGNLERWSVKATECLNLYLEIKLLATLEHFRGLLSLIKRTELSLKIIHTLITEETFIFMKKCVVTVSWVLYLNVQNHLRVEVQQKHPENWKMGLWISFGSLRKWILDQAQPVFCHTPYSWDFSDIFLFPRMKITQKRKSF